MKRLFIYLWLTVAFMACQTIDPSIEPEQEQEQEQEARGRGRTGSCGEKRKG